jgi:hypothetical protein
MGWSGTAPVYRLERPGPDTPRPNPDTINMVAQVLELDYANRMTLLGFAGNLLDTEPLSVQEEAQLIDWTRPMMETSDASMILFDYRDRILATTYYAVARAPSAKRSAKACPEGSASSE